MPRLVPTRRALAAVAAATAATLALGACGSSGTAAADRTAAGDAGLSSVRTSTLTTLPTALPTALPTSPSATDAPTVASVLPPPPATTPPPAPVTTPQTSAPPPAPPAPPAPSALPLSYPTENATQIITVTAPSTRSTTATVQAWQRDGAGWLRVGPAVSGHVGSNGMSPNTREGLAATPMGSFTLTEAFGRAANPGARLPYRQTTPADWWISQPGPLYNTWQTCSANCPFNQGNPNEHLAAIWQYDYAVVIDYNRAPVTQGAGSAFFLHVSDGSATAGCVSIAQDQMVRLLTWLDPNAHPRILIGTA